MEIPLASAAKRGCIFILVRITVKSPPQGPSDSIYFRMTGPAVEAEPASARPNPSRIVFLPRAITLSGMSSYFVLTINSETYFVSPGALGNSSAGFGKASARSPRSAKPARASEVLQKSRRIMGSPVGQASACRVSVLPCLPHDKRQANARPTSECRGDFSERLNPAEFSPRGNESQVCGASLRVSTGSQYIILPLIALKLVRYNF